MGRREFDPSLVFELDEKTGREDRIRLNDRSPARSQYVPLEVPVFKPGGGGLDHHEDDDARKQNGERSLDDFFGFSHLISSIRFSIVNKKIAPSRVDRLRLPFLDFAPSDNVRIVAPSPATVKKKKTAATQAAAKSSVEGRAFNSPLARSLYARANTAEVDPRAEPGAPAADDFGQPFRPGLFPDNAGIRAEDFVKESSLIEYNISRTTQGALSWPNTPEKNFPSSTAI
jgi:hypothetical protein